MDLGAASRRVSSTTAGVALALSLIALAWLAPSADAVEEYPDEIVFAGNRLYGEVQGFGAQEIEFKVHDAGGTLSIPYEAVSLLRTRRVFRVYLGDGSMAMGRLLGIKEGNLLVGDDVATVERLPLSEIDWVIRENRYRESFPKRLRTYFRYWTTDVQFGVRFDDGAVEKTKVEVATDIERNKGPTHLLFDLYYAFETQRTLPDPQTTTKDELNANLLGKYEILHRLFLFGLPAAGWDRPRNVALRTYPTGGLGYWLFDGERFRLNLRGGFGYVYEEFSGSEPQTKSYAVGHIGLESTVLFPYDIELGLQSVYMPGISNPGDDWLFRTRATLRVPVYGPLSLNIAIREVNDDNPTPDTGDNKITTTWAFGLRF